MLILQPKGLYCPYGDFYIDPKGKVDHAVVTHAHSDHARRGASTYYSTKSGEGLLRCRLGEKIHVRSFDYSEPFYLGDVKISFHPAGHILGSAQVRLERDGEVWVASGDYKRDYDPTCEPFETVECDTFVTEATFGTPAYQWSKDADIGHEILNWWDENAVNEKNSVLFAYSLGKTQRVLGLLEPLLDDHRPIYLHPSARELTEAYRSQGVPLAKTICLSELAPDQELRGELILGPRAILNEKFSQNIGQNYLTAFASGWTARSDYGYDRGFTLSDHADWNDLVRTIRESKARRVYVQHRGAGALVRHLKSLGLDAHPEEKLIVAPGQGTQLSFGLGAL